MNLSDRIEAFHKLGETIEKHGHQKHQQWVEPAVSENAWFTPDTIRLALFGIRKFLHYDTLKLWTSRYQITDNKSSKVGVVMAGNIPLVGFHDLLCVLISGNTILIKESSKDSVLIRQIVKELLQIAPYFENNIIFSGGSLKNFDAIIATGSNNTVRYFEYYFGRYPNIIRKNRTSCAILRGGESLDKLKQLGSDIFTYFGLGCRNVSKILIPENYEINYLLEAWQEFLPIQNHHKYKNNYDYQKAIYLVNQTPHYDTGFLIVSENKKVASAIAVLHYEYYYSENDLVNKIIDQTNQLQCIVGEHPLATVPFGASQTPNVWDYADNIDTLEFLTKKIWE